MDYWYTHWSLPAVVFSVYGLCGCWTPGLPMHSIFWSCKHNTEQKYTTLGYLRYVSDVWTMWRKAIIMLIHAQHTTNSYVTKLQYGTEIHNFRLSQIQCLTRMDKAESDNWSTQHATNYVTKLERGIGRHVTRHDDSCFTHNMLPTHT